MYKKTYNCKIIYKQEIASGIIDMRVKSEEITKQAKPGQFLNVKCCEAMSVLLRRPISICDIDKEKQELRFIFQIKGEGTKLLANHHVGDTIDIMGPLGKPFIIDAKYTNPVFIGGGIGVFPLLMLAKNLPAKDKAVYLGFRNKDLVVMEDEFKEISNDCQITTDDGSYGIKGFATQLLEEKIKNENVDIVYACGPEPMLKIIKNICSVNDIPCQLSMEQRMGCGIGACLVCACKTKKEEDWEYQHVCKDGPVFWGDEVIFDEE